MNINFTSMLEPMLKLCKDLCCHEQRSEIEKLNLKNDSLQEKLQERKEKMQEAASRFKELQIAGKIDQSLPPLFEQFEKAVTSYSDDMRSCRLASEWVKHKQDIWAEEATSITAKEYATSLLKDKEKLFQQDIANYIGWVYDALRNGGFDSKRMKSSLEELNTQRHIKESTPYVKALKFIFSKKDISDLSTESIKFFNMCFEHLLSKV
jgi:hypothetical protein